LVDKKPALPPRKESLKALTPEQIADKVNPENKAWLNPVPKPAAKDMFNSPQREDGMPGVNRFSDMPTAQLFDSTTRSDPGMDRPNKTAPSTPLDAMAPGALPPRVAALKAAMPTESPVTLPAAAAVAATPVAPKSHKAKSKQTPK
jgi:hypothetical protein